jgi:polygalacturonase
VNRCLILLSCPILFAQDTRQVSEPHFPPSCTVLKARGEKTPDTQRIQAAIDGCSPGKAVEFKADGSTSMFLTGPISLKTGVTLLIDAGAALAASSNPRDYDLTPGSCGVVNERGHGCKPMIVAEQAPGAAIMGDGVIDGRGGATITGQKVSWWDLAHEAKVKDLQQSVPRMLVVRQSDGFVLYRISLRNSPNFHVTVERTNGFTAWGVKIFTPKTARNTDGIDPSSSQNVTITHCDISTGDDNVAIKAGSAGASTHMTIAHNHFYTGHGMSIGSNTDGGVSAVRVSDLSIDGADNGIRIKSDRSRGGLVQDVSYENVCLRDVKNPIVLTPLYSKLPGNKLPLYKDILLKDVHSVMPGHLTFVGLDTQHKLEVTLDNVTVDGVKQKHIEAENADIRIGPRAGNLVPTGPNVTATDSGHGAATPLNCDNRFVAYPPLAAPVLASNAPPPDETFYVSTTGTGDYSSIQRAIDTAPETGAIIQLAPGTYREVVTIAKPNIHLRSSSTDPTRTVIVFDNSAGTSGGTFHSATVNVTGDNFLAENLTIANDFNATHAQEPQGSQALALSVTADLANFRNVRLLGNRDTLYAGSKGAAARQYFSNCYIEGNVDFIFGDANARFDHCKIHSTPHSIGYITAQGKKSAEQDSTFVFDHCKLTADPGVSHVWLGRPWRPYASVVFLNTEMGEHIEPAGWREWHPGETHYMDTVSYAEYNSTGPGAHTGQRDPRTKILTVDQVDLWRRLLVCCVHTHVDAPANKSAEMSLGTAGKSACATNPRFFHDGN